VDTPISTFKFKRMSWMLSLRDLFIHPGEFMDEVEIQPGFRVLDYGCGKGSFTFAAAQRVGPEGKVYALDIHPHALEKVQEAALKKGFANIETIQTSCITQVPGGSIDVVLFYYVLHWLTDPDCVLGELYRVLKPNGLLSFRDPYMKEDEILRTVTERGWFRLSGKGEKAYRFTRITRNEPIAPPLQEPKETNPP